MADGETFSVEKKKKKKKTSGGNGEWWRKNNNSNNTHHPCFAFVANGTKHSVGITPDGVAYTWGRSNALGQLGRRTTTTTTLPPSSNEKPPPPATAKKNTPGVVPVFNGGHGNNNNKAVKAYVGGNSDSGHTAILDSSGTLWMTGCDRWQQLGLGSSRGGSCGYTWEGGALWQPGFRPAVHLRRLMEEGEEEEPPNKEHKNKPREEDGRRRAAAATTIRDVALGGDHTLVLASNRRDVYAFGKGGEGQLGLVGKPFVSGHVRSTTLSREGTAAVCSIDACSATLNDEGRIHAQAGKCRKILNEVITACRKRAEKDGLLYQRNENRSSRQRQETHNG